MLPGLALGVGLFILIDGALSSISRIALWLAVATLLTVGIRLLLSARSLRIITEERYRQAHTDELTGLGNRRQLSLILDLFFADEVDTDATPREMAFLFVDLNHFKEINDSFGHPAGDELLRQLGPRLTRAVGESGSVVRLGGDELAVVLIDADADVAIEVAQRIMAKSISPSTCTRSRRPSGPASASRWRPTTPTTDRR